MTNMNQHSVDRSADLSNLNPGQIAASTNALIVPLPIPNDDASIEGGMIEMMHKETIRVNDYADYDQEEVNSGRINTDLRNCAQSSTRLISEPYNERSFADDGDQGPSVTP